MARPSSRNADTGPRPRPSRHRPAWQRAWPILPILLFLGIFFLYPMYGMLSLGFKGAAGEFSLVHFQKLLTTPVYLKVLVVTLKISAWTTVVSIVCGYPVAYLLATSREQTRNTLILLILMPFWTGFLVRTFAWMILLGQNGPINEFLQFIGLTGTPVPLIYNMTGVLIGMGHALMPLAILSMLSVMQDIDQNLVRAAGSLGARGGQAFWRVYFPLSLPGVAAAGLLVFITALGFFITPTMLGSPAQTMLAQIIIMQIQELLNWGFAAALSVVLLASALIVFYLYDRILGISTLAGERAYSTRRGARGAVWLSRLGARSRQLLVTMLGNSSDAIAIAWEHVVPPRHDRPRRQVSRLIWWGVAALVLGFLVLPSFFVIPVSFSSTNFLDFPPEGFSLQWYAKYLESSIWVAATLRSFGVALATAALAMLLGTAAAFVLVRQNIFGRRAILALLLSPLIIPRVAIAVALFYLYARLHLVGTVLGLVIGHTILAFPYVVVTVMAVLKVYDQRLDQAAWSLGANKAQAMYHVTLPLLRSGLIAAGVFAFVTSFDDLNIALFVTGGLQNTLPNQMWSSMLLQANPIIGAVSTLLLIVITTVIFLAEFMRRRAARPSAGRPLRIRSRAATP